MTKPNQPGGESIRYFECVDEKNSKFWEIAIDDFRVDVRCGKIGTTGQSQTKEFGDAVVATVRADKLVAEKLAKGYVEVGTGGAQAANTQSRPTSGAVRMINPIAQLAAAKSPETPPTILDMLANSDRESVLLSVAENITTSVATRTLALQKLIDRDVFVRKIASSPLTPPPLLEVLSRHQMDEVRLDVAENRATPEVALTALASDSFRDVRNTVACNESTPAHVLEVLAKDSDPWVVSGTVINPNAPVHILEQMSRSKNSNLRFGVTLNRATPNHILELLSNDEVLQVRKRAKDVLKEQASQLARQALRVEKKEAPLVNKEKSTLPKSDKKKPIAAKATKANTELIVNRSEKIQKQVARASELKRIFIDDIKSYFPDVLKPKMSDSDERSLLSLIELAAESFNVAFQPCRVDAVDRTSSMLSGPFLTSKKHPIPKSKSEMLYPIVQLDLRTASLLAGEPLGDGLLQLWYDINTLKGLVRVIPRQDVNLADVTEFRFIPAKKFDGFPLPSGWNSDPIGETVQVMSGFKSIGMACQQGYGAVYLDDLGERYEVPAELYGLVEKFERLTDVESNSKLQLLGSFYPIQYSAAEVGKRCLFAIGGDWGASGAAQVFYEIGKNGQTSFTFLDCLR